MLNTTMCETNNSSHDVIQQKNYGTLYKEYTKDGLTVKVYSPELSENDRIKKDVEIRKKVAEIIKKLTS